MKISLFYEHVTVLDYAYLDHHKGPVGNSLVVDVEFIGKTDEEGILYDFSYAKKKVKEIIDRECDHRLVVPKDLLKKEKKGYASMKFLFGPNDDFVEYMAPSQAYCEIPNSHVSEDNLKTHLEELIIKEMPKNVIGINLKFKREESPDNVAYFHYLHGLRCHYGNCQRLFHGHRSTIKIFINGERAPTLEEALANDLFAGNIKFVYWENVVNKNEIVKITKSKKPVGRVLDVDRIELSYTGSQGEFTGSVPGKIAYIIHEETTVENLALHFKELVASMVDKKDRIEVHAFEGIGKGAIVSL